METDEDDKKTENSTDFVDNVLRDIAGFIAAKFCKPDKLDEKTSVEDFLARMRLVCNTLSYEENLCFKDLEVKMIPSLLTYANRLEPGRIFNSSDAWQCLSMTDVDNIYNNLAMLEGFFLHVRIANFPW